MKDQLKDDLLKECEKSGPVELSSLATTFETHPITIESYCEDLQSNGYIYQTAQRKYEVTVDGREWLSSYGGIEFIAGD